MKRRIQAADSIRFCVRGRGAQRLLGQAAQAGLKLERIAPQADGFTAVVSGAGWAKLCQLAGAGGWQVIQMQRRGPGPLAERLLRRPGILAGIILAVGRIVGETAALMYTAGTSTDVCTGFLKPCRTLAVHMYQLLCEGKYMGAAYATAVVLLVMVILINALSGYVAKKLTKK